jgi:hypothetical protein
MSKPRLFIGSSSESKPVALAFIAALRSCAAPVGWWQAREFRIGQNTLQSLMAAAQSYDFGLFILGADDDGSSRHKRYLFPRDNVLFEHGLFLGSLGVERSFAVLQVSHGSSPVKLPADLEGITIPRYDRKFGARLNQSVQDATEKICSEIKRLGRRHGALAFIKGYGCSLKNGELTVTLDSHAIARHRDFLQGQLACVIVRKEDEYSDFANSKQVAFSTPRLFRREDTQDLRLKVSTRSFFSRLKMRDMIEGRLMIMPARFKPAKDMTLAGMKALGLAADGFAVRINK